jgi:CMP-N,N'-diacetyllegionaminic acid synthase|tara:strand:+ start:357 stop:1058 length:702 start_codon:yes stop_codon:yes gene_type:complete
MTVIGIIPARSGSKGVPNKNIRQLGRMPLLGWSISAAKKSHKIDKLIFSSDSDEYFKIAKSFDNELIFHKRSQELSEDVSSELVILDILKYFKDLFDDDSIIVMLQPTTPFITSNDIDECIRKLVENNNSNSCVTVKKVSEYPEWMILQRTDFSGSHKIKSDVSIRQNLKKKWIPNGGAYVVRKSFLEKSKMMIDNTETLVHEMSKIRSMDIDDEEDFKLCESIVNSNLLNIY